MHGMSEATEPVEPKRKGFKISWGVWIGLLAIVGIGVAVGMASYGDYTHRSQNAEAGSLLISARTGLAVEFQEHAKWPENLDKVVNTTSGKYTESVRITKGAGGAGEIELTATMRTEGVDRRVAGKTIRMVSSNGGKTWICKPGTMNAEYLPADCRKN